MTEQEIRAFVAANRVYTADKKSRVVLVADEGVDDSTAASMTARYGRSRTSGGDLACWVIDDVRVVDGELIWGEL
jgi:hypothetical protein